jgi:anti-anti-sigma regulatory factor
MTVDADAALPAADRAAISFQLRTAYLPLELRGALSAGASALIQNAIGDACSGQRDLVLDLRQVTSIDATACRELEQLRRRQIEQGMQFLAIGATAGVRRQCLSYGAAVLLAGAIQGRRRRMKRTDGHTRHCVDLAMRRAERTPSTPRQNAVSPPDTTS